MIVRWAFPTNIFILTLLFFNFLKADVPRNARVDCAPRPGDSKDDCISRGCIWDDHFEKSDPSVPICYFPKKSGYVVDRVENQTHLRLKSYDLGAKNPYGEQFANLNVHFRQIRKSTLKISIAPDEKRYVPPVPVNEGLDCQEECADTDETLAFKFAKDSVFSFTVERPDGSKIWDTSIGGLTFADKYIQIATYLPTDRIYGFGEHIHQTLKHDFSEYRTWPMFSIDEPTNSETFNTNNHYGVHAFYVGLDPTSGKAHGVFILNSNAQEVTTGPAPHLVYRTIGGQLDIYFFAGPRPEDVVRQYLDLIGRPFLPAYWAFGFQLCRYGFTGVDDIKAVVERIQKAKIPFDVIYSDIDYMDRYNDFSLSPQEQWADFPQFSDELHQQNLHLILIFDPAIQANYHTFQRAIDKNASFIEWPRKELVQHSIQDLYPLAKDTKVMLGVVWPDQHVAFPDFLDPSKNTEKWWIDEFVAFHKILGFDGIWIDMNEPSNFETNHNPAYYPPSHPNIEALQCPLDGADSALDSPPYYTWSVYLRGKDHLSMRSLCMLGTSGRGQYTQYDVHSIYGYTEAVATSAALHASTGKRGSHFSRSTFAGSGVYAGHWLGDNFAKWEDLRTSIIGIQEFNIFGIPFVGADVCGFIDKSNEELCLRWQQLGAFYPFFRNHNDIASPPQDPPQWDSVAKATRIANLFRYQHLPYLYSLHFRATIFGGTVVRPLFFEFPTDALAQETSFEFMWGPSMVVIPVTSPETDFVHSYLPLNETWYSGSFAHNYGTLVPSGFSDFEAPHDTPLPVFIRGGSVIPRQRPSLTLKDSRKNEFQLLVALSGQVDGNQKAYGELFWDDGETIFNVPSEYNNFHFKYAVTASSERTDLVINCTKGYDVKEKLTLPTLDTIEVFGYQYRPAFSSATLNGKPITISTQKSSYSAAKKVLKIDTASLINLNENGPIWIISLKNSEFLHIPY